MITGKLERVDREFIEGWAFDTSYPSRFVEVAIEIEGSIVWRGPADRYRQDLNDAGIGDGHHHFSVSISSLGSLPRSLVQVNVWIEDTEQLLSGSPSALVEVENDEETFAALDIVRPFEIVGNLDVVSTAGIRGWAYDRSRASTPVSVDLMIDGHYAARTNADLFRPDLLSAGFGSGHCAFVFAPPLTLLDRAAHRIQVVPTNLHRELHGSPQVVCFEHTSPIHHLIALEARFTSAIESMRREAETIKVSASGVVSTEAHAQDYYSWYKRYVAINVERRVQILQQIAAFENSPTISILMPTFNTPPKMLRAAIDSVRNQIYPRWQLCIVDDCSSRIDTRRVLRSYLNVDERIQIKMKDENEHISLTTNQALGMATGDYVALLDHDDELSEDALFRIVLAILCTNADMIYSDEDKIDARGSHFDPHFKPAFNYTLLLSYNYICHFLTVRRRVALQVGGFRDETVGSQDYDFVLRLCEVVNHDAIVHVPHVLYHWRVHEASTALSQSAKSYVVDAAKIALSDHLLAMDTQGDVSEANGIYRVRWHLPSPAPRVSIIIPTRDCADILSLCLSGILHRTDYPDLEIIIVDNGSVDKSTASLFEQVAKDSRVRVISYDAEFNYSAICNFGASFATGSLLLMMNNDIEVQATNSDWLSELVSQVSRPSVGAAGAKLLYPNRRVQHAGIIMGLGGVAGHSHKYSDENDPGYFNRLRVSQELSGCTAACLIIRKQIFWGIGGFDESNLPVAFNDVDLCLRIREAGWQIVFTPFASLIHHESYSRGAEDSPAKIVRAQGEVMYMRKRWADVLGDDPAYSPSLTLDREDFGRDQHRGPDHAMVYRIRNVSRLKGAPFANENA